MTHLDTKVWVGSNAVRVVHFLLPWFSLEAATYSEALGRGAISGAMSLRLVSYWAEAYVTVRLVPSLKLKLMVPFVWMVAWSMRAFHASSV